MKGEWNKQLQHSHSPVPRLLNQLNGPSCPIQLALTETARLEALSSRGFWRIRHSTKRAGSTCKSIAFLTVAVLWHSMKATADCAGDDASPSMKATA